MSQVSATVPQEAIDALQVFLDASQRKDEPGMRACLSKQTIESGAFHGESPQDAQFVLGEARREEDRVVIPLRILPVGAEPDGDAMMEMSCVMVLEDGAWKFDLVSTMERGLGGAMVQAMEVMTDAMTQAMQGVGEALAAGLESAFSGDQSSSHEPAEPLPEAPNWDDVSLAIEDDEYLPMFAMTALPKTTAAVSEALGAPIAFEVAADDILAPFGEEQRDVMINWFEDSLFVNWATMLARVAQGIPLVGRLRAIRIENAMHFEHRCVALDGSDLVYRIRLPESEGFYSDDELSLILPSVLAALPDESEAMTEGRRTLPANYEMVSLDLYKDRIVPRYMRRISEVLGKPLAFNAAWDDLLYIRDAANHLHSWGMNRIYGAMVLVCHDEGMRLQLQERLHTIRLTFTYDPNQRGAVLADGVLKIRISPDKGDQGCFYDYAIADAMTGLVIGDIEGIDGDE